MQYIQSTAVTDEVHWKFYRQMTSDIFTDAGDQAFGYFTFSPDQYAYQAKYALHYFSKENALDIVPFTKLPITYLVLAPNDHKNPWANEDFWKSNQVKISGIPDKTWTYSTSDAMSYTIEKFKLDENEINIKADPNLIDGIHFR